LFDKQGWNIPAPLSIILQRNGFSEMQIEKRALLDHAGRCRRTADEIEMEHARAAERLIAMAQEYEARAATFGDANESCRAPGWRRSVDGLAVAAFAALALLVFACGKLLGV
jgi:ferric-dicitrate binding protein FerR (iron transport regulator)